MNPWDEQPNRRARRIKTALLLLSVIIAPAVMVILTVQPSFVKYRLSAEQVDSDRLRLHVRTLSEDFFPRNFSNISNLDSTAAYISNHLARAGGTVSEQAYEVDGRWYRNVAASFGSLTGPRIVVGAHYDSYGDSPGADDNASGVAGLIELGYLLGHSKLEQQVELVAYTLEEPPFFRSKNMGSARHAHRLHKDKVDLEAMLCLEMIGFFSDWKKSQAFPSILLQWLYPDTGNFIAVIGSTADRKLARQVKVCMRGATDLPVHALCAPKGFPGLDFSDHLNYWRYDFRAIMITDTAFMRNPRYHRPSDTADTLDYDRMAKVVVGVYEAVMHLADGEN